MLFNCKRAWCLSCAAHDMGLTAGAVSMAHLLGARQNTLHNWKWLFFFFQDNWVFLFFFFLGVHKRLTNIPSSQLTSTRIGKIYCRNQIPLKPHGYLISLWIQFSEQMPSILYPSFASGTISTHFSSILSCLLSLTKKILIGLVGVLIAKGKCKCDGQQGPPTPSLGSRKNC